ncbi:MAG: tripartite tricarboxylate transporter TctB family protein, partial [Spirochaetaceae bacterium]|nr:tripartite tricarboxylate transporter TctB family protein [Spirochaetaceae bacterium]
MALELIVNILQLVLSGICFWYVGATMPVSPENELGAEQWPQMLLVLLMIAIVYNIFKFFKAHKKEAVAAAFADFFPGVLRFLKSKLFIGMVIVMAMALVYEPLGFVMTCLLFLVSYGILLGERRPVVLAVSSLGIMLLLYIGFSVFLGVML